MLDSISNKKGIKFYQIPTLSEENNHEKLYESRLETGKLDLNDFNHLEQQREQEYFNLVFQYSKRNAFMAQELVIESNFQAPLCQNNNLKQSRQLQAQSPRVSRPFFINPSFQELQKQENLFSLEQNKINQENGGLMNQSKKYLNQNQQKQKKSRVKYHKTLKSHNNNEQTLKNGKRISILIQKGEQKNSNKHNNQQQFQQQDYIIPSQSSNNGVIPLRTNFRPQSIVIHTYRQIKSRLQNIQQQERQKHENNKKQQKMLKKQQSRFKGLLINYDYDGEPIPVKGFKKHQTMNLGAKNGMNLNNVDSVEIVPLNQNIILPSSINKKRLEKRKARYINQQQEKENYEGNQKKHFQQQKIVIYEGSDFIKKIPQNIKKNKLFSTQKQTHKIIENKETFTQYKKSLQKARGLVSYTHHEHPQQLKSQKFHYSNLSDVKQQQKIKSKSKKKINLSHDKVILNQKVFEKAFNVRTYNDYDCESTMIAGKNNDQPCIRFASEVETNENRSNLYDMRSKKGGLGQTKLNSKSTYNINSRKPNKISMHMLGVNHTIELKKVKSNNQQQQRTTSNNLQQKQRTSIFRSHNNSPKKSIGNRKNIYQNQIENVRHSMNGIEERKFVKNDNKGLTQASQNRGLFQGLGKRERFMNGQTKRKLKTRPSCRNIMAFS